MADQQPQSEAANKVGLETTDRGMFDFLKKKKDEEKPVENEKHTLAEKLHHSESDSSSSSDDEEEDGEKRKKKNGLKGKIKESAHKGTLITDQQCENTGSVEATHTEERKGFLEKIKEKLPGYHNEAEEEEGSASKGAPAAAAAADGHSTEKKGILVKIKDKLPGCHKTDEDGKERKEKEN